MKSSKNNSPGRKKLTGKVISDKMDKTRVVEVQRMLRHSTYGKVIRRNKKYYAHDEQNTSAAGDTVVIEESRPLSKMKRWRVLQVKGKK